MSNNISFKRKFFILKKEYSNMRNLNPKGHGKLELRNNRLNISINIDNAESDNYYNILLIGDNKAHDLGKIHTDKKCSGKAEFEFNYKDIESLGFPLEKINGILIERDRNILLGGNVDKADRTIENYLDKLAREDDYPPQQAVAVEVVAAEEVVEVEEVTKIEIEETNVASYPEEEEEKYIINDLAQEDLPPTCEITEDVDTEDSVQLENRPPLAEDQYMPIYETPQPAPPSEAVTQEEYHKAMQDMFNDPSDPEVDFQEDEVEYVDVDTQRKLNQKNQTTSYVLNILSFFPFIEPFKIDLMGYNWWKIEIDDPREDKGFLPYFSYIAGGNHRYPLVQNTVTATALMRKYGHYLFGLYNVKDEVKFYVYGVPGRFITEDHPQKGTTGFNTWFEGRDNVGYWLLYIDPLTGRIIYPINPMIPKD